MGFQNLQTLSLSLFPLWIFRPIFQAFCPKMEGCGDFSPNISSARLAEYNSVLQCGRGVKSWSFQQVWCLHPHSEKLKSPPPALCYYLQCHSTEGRKVRSPGCWLLRDQESRTCLLRKRSTSAVPRGSDLSVFSLGLCSQNFIWTSVSWSPAR